MPFALTGPSHTHTSLLSSLFADVAAFQNHTHLLAHCHYLSGAARGGHKSSLHPSPLVVKVLSVGVGRDGDVDDEGCLVLDASIFAVGQSSDLHAVRAGLS